jgi:hypothetical protein
VEAAIKFVKFASNQVASLHTEFSDRKALAPNLMKILQAAERQGGKITTREAQHIFPLKGRPIAQTVREWFSQLQQMKYGQVTTVKKSVSFTLTTTTVTTVTQNLDTESVKPDHSTPEPLTTMTTVNDATVVNCGLTVVKDEPQSKPLCSKVLNTTVVTVVNNSAPSEKSETLLLSYTTEPEEFTQQIRKAIVNFDKAKKKLRNEVKNALTPDERQNFKLLAKAGFLRGTRVKYVGHSKYAEQYEGLELEVFSMDEYFEITCLKPDGAGYTTRLKPEELEAIS